MADSTLKELNDICRQIVGVGHAGGTATCWTGLHRVGLELCFVLSHTAMAQPTPASESKPLEPSADAKLIVHLMKRIAELESQLSAPMPATGGFGASSAAQHSTGFAQIAPGGFGAAAPSSAFGTPASNPGFAFGIPAARPPCGRGTCPKCNDFWHFGECSQSGINADLQRRISMLEHNVNAIWQKMQK